MLSTITLCHDSTARTRLRSSVLPGDGYLGADDLKAAFPKGADVHRLIDSADTNKDGKISLEECVSRHSPYPSCVRARNLHRHASDDTRCCHCNASMQHSVRARA